MKSKRQEKILELIAQYAIETQEELLERLSECGIPSTQATVSRDIKQLHLYKSRAAADATVTPPRRARRAATLTTGSSASCASAA